MSSNYPNRLIMIVPSSRVAGVAAWMRANVDATFPSTCGPGLSATGNAPATYFWTSTAYNLAQMQAIGLEMCTAAGATFPNGGVWNGWTLAQQIAFIVSVCHQIYTNFGIWLDLSDNTNPPAWDLPSAVLANLAAAPGGVSLQVVS